MLFTGFFTARKISNCLSSAFSWVDYRKARELTRLLLFLMAPGQSQPPCYLSMFLEVTDSLNTSYDWSCFVHYRVSVINQKGEERSITKESQSRYSKSAKEFGWPEFVTLASLFDQDSGLLVQDTIAFSVDLLILKETSLLEDCTESSNACFEIDQDKKLGSFTWKVENFLSFKEIMQNRKIFSKFFEVGGCELRIGESVFLILFIWLFSASSLSWWLSHLDVLLACFIIAMQGSTSHLTQFLHTWSVTHLL